MKKILIATHGHLASGFESAARILAGDSVDIQHIDAYTEDEPGDYTPKIEAFVSSISDGDQGVIFTDILAGSVNQKVCQVLAAMGDRPNVFLVTGTNLMAVLAVVLEFRPISAEVLKELVSQTAVEVVELSAPKSEEVVDEDAFLS